MNGGGERVDECLKGAVAHFCHGFGLLHLSFKTFWSLSVFSEINEYKLDFPVLEK